MQGLTDRRHEGFFVVESTGRATHIFETKIGTQTILVLEEAKTNCKLLGLKLNKKCSSLRQKYLLLLCPGKEPRFTNWARKQPDNRGHFGRQEDCAYIKTNMQWNDWDCHAKDFWGWTLNALCEKTGN